jgi:hypothetical protein
MAGSSAAERTRIPPDATPPDTGMLRVIREAISEATLRPEADAVSELRAGLVPVERNLGMAKSRAIHWVEVARADKRPRPFAESMMEQFPLDSAQGRALMSLAEALLRTPDPARADQLIAERLAEVRGGGRNPPRLAATMAPRPSARRITSSCGPALRSWVASAAYFPTLPPNSPASSPWHRSPNLWLRPWCAQRFVERCAC